MIFTGKRPLWTRGDNVTDKDMSNRTRYTLPVLYHYPFHTRYTLPALTSTLFVPVTPFRRLPEALPYG